MTSDLLRSLLPVLGDEDLLTARPAPRNGGSGIDAVVSLSELLDMGAFRDVCASFVELYKIGIKIFDAEGTKLVDIRVGNGDWCGYIFQNSVGRQRCTALVGQIKQHEYPGLESGVVVDQACFSGLKYKIMPISYGGDCLGRVIYGPFMPAEIDQPGAEVRAFPDGFDVDRLWRYGDKIRRAPDEMVMKILANFRGVIETITFVAMKALMTQRLHAESITASYNELALANRKLRESYEKLRELDRLKSSFLAMISHELRTPLTSVIGYSEMLIEGMAGELNDEQRAYVGTIKDKGDSLLEMIASLLDMTKIEAGAMDLKISEIDVVELLEAAKSYIVPQATKKSISLEIHAERELPRLTADRDKVRQALINLLGNAVKFTPSGGRISMRASVVEAPRRNATDSGRFGPPNVRFMSIEVRDTGIGIPGDKLEKVFNSFYQVDNSITREYGGTGLGLAIVKRLVEAHHGEVWAESAEKQGAAFTLRLPLEPEPLEVPPPAGPF